MSLVPISTNKKYQKYLAPPAKTAFQIKAVLDIKNQQQLSISYHQFSPAVFALPVVKPIYQLLFLATSPFSPHLSHTPTLNLLPPVAISSSAPTIPNVLPVSHPKPVFLRPITPTAPQSPNGTGNKVFVIRSLGSQNIPARASKWLEKNLHLLEIRLRLLSFKR